MASQKVLVAWDFSEPPPTTFYDMYRDEFSPAEVKRIQRSVVICQDDFTARRLCALGRAYGATVEAFALQGELPTNRAADREAEEYVERIRSQRLHRRGRRPSRRTGKRGRGK